MTEEAGLWRLTARQAEALDIIRGFIDDHGYGPSVQDVADAMGLATKSAAWYHLHNLERDGWIARDAGIARSVRPTDRLYYVGWAKVSELRRNGSDGAVDC